MKSGRREVLKMLSWLSAWAALGCRSQPPLAITPSASPTTPAWEWIVRNSRPLDAETPVDYFVEALTPNPVFFVRSHHPEPRVDLESWGLVVGQRSFNLAQLQAMEPRSLVAVLQCSGNGRAFFQPRVPGIPWERGAVGNARWKGVPLARVLEAAGVDPQKFPFVVFRGADRPLMDSVPAFLRQLPMARCLHPDVLLAYEMNGQPLPHLHGAPLRLVVPGWYGEDWIKWLSRIEPQTESTQEFYYKTAYRYEGQPISEMRVKSLFASPPQGTHLAGEVQLRGVAWSGSEAHIEQVEISDDAGQNWRPAHLEGRQEDYGWRLWSCAWTPPRPGKTWTLLCRARDSQGKVQPLDPSPWNPSGYLWNSVDRLEVFS